MGELIQKDVLFITDFTDLFNDQENKYGYLKPFIQFGEFTYYATPFIKNKVAEIDESGKPQKPNKKETEEYFKILLNEIQEVRPKVIIPVGGLALKMVTESTAKITNMQGIPVQGDGYYLLPIYHPSVSEHKKDINLLEVYKKNFELVEKIVKGEYQENPFDYKMVETEKEFLQFIMDAPGVMAFDVEDTVQENDPSKNNIYKKGIDVLTVSFSWEAGKAICVPVFHRESPFIDEGNYLPTIGDSHKNYSFFTKYFKKLFENRRFIAHNAKYEYCVMRHFFGVETNILHDTMILAHLLDENRLVGLLPLTKQYLPQIANYGDRFRGEFQSLSPKLRNYGEVNLDLLYHYNCWHSDCTNQLLNIFIPELEHEQKIKNLYKTISLPMLKPLGLMEEKGMLLSEPTLKKVVENTIWKIVNTGHEIQNHPSVIEATDLLVREKQKETVFNPNSTDHLKKLMFDVLKLKSIEETDTGEPSTGKAVRDHYKIKVPIIQVIDDYKSYQGDMTKYLKPMNLEWKDDSFVVHTTFKPTGAVTGRLASADPNLQNIKDNKEIKCVFIPRVGYVFISFDHSQVELRVLAHVSQDKYMLDCYRKGIDLHGFTAERIFGKNYTDEHRYKAKRVNFSIVYGTTAKGLAIQLKCDEEEAQILINEILKLFKGVDEWIKDTIALCKSRGYVTTESGRKRRLPDITSYQLGDRLHAQREAVNAPIQGYANDITLLGLIHTANYPDARQVVIIHDDIKFEVREKLLQPVARGIKQIMENVVQLSVPLQVDIKWGYNLGEMEKYEIQKS